METLSKFIFEFWEIRIIHGNMVRVMGALEGLSSMGLKGMGNLLLTR